MILNGSVFGWPETPNEPPEFDLAEEAWETVRTQLRISAPPMQAWPDPRRWPSPLFVELMRVVVAIGATLALHHPPPTAQVLVHRVPPPQVSRRLICSPLGPAGSPRGWPATSPASRST